MRPARPALPQAPQTVAARVGPYPAAPDADARRHGADREHRNAVPGYRRVDGAADHDLGHDFRHLKAYPRAAHHPCVRTFLRIVANVLTALLLPITVGAVHASATFGAVFAPRADASSVAPPPRLYDPAKPTAAVVLGTHGTVASDALAPYEILAASGAFNVYTVAQ